VGEAVYAIDDFPDDDLLWRIGWIGGVGYNTSVPIDKDIIFGIRPEHITNEPKEGSSVPVTLTVDIAEPMGSESLVHLKTGTGNLIARIHGEHLFHLGEQLNSIWKRSLCLMLKPKK
jgi:ABC-type sugar transport system ATPase subunit